MFGSVPLGRLFWILIVQCLFLLGCGGGGSGGAAAAQQPANPQAPPNPQPPAVAGYVSTGAEIFNASLVHGLVTSSDDVHAYAIVSEGPNRAEGFRIVHYKLVGGAYEVANAVPSDSGGDIRDIVLLETSQQILTVEEIQGQGFYVHTLDIAQDGSLISQGSSQLVDPGGGFFGSRTFFVPPDERQVYMPALTTESYGLLVPRGGKWELDRVVEEDGAYNTLIAFNPVTDHVYFGRNTVSVYERDPDTGLLTFLSTFVNVARSENYDFSNVTSLLVSPDGTALYVTADGVSRVAGISNNTAVVAAVSIDGGSGELSSIGFHLPGVWDVGAGDMSPDGKHVYVAGKSTEFYYGQAIIWTNTSIHVYERQSNNGLSHLEDIPLPILVRPKPRLSNNGSGLFIYSLWLEGSQLYLYDRDPSSGTLSNERPIHTTDSEVGGLRRVNEIELNGSYVVAGDPVNDTLGVLRFDQTTKEFTRTDWLDFRVFSGGEYEPPKFKFSPDNRHAYAMAQWEQTLKFNFDSAAGTMAADDALTPLNSFIVQDAAFSASGEDVYFGGLIRIGNGQNETNAGVTHLKREVSSGELTVRSTYDPGRLGGAMARVFGTHIVLSHDETHVYVANRGSAEVQVYSRDITTGELLYLDSIEDRTQEADGRALEGLFDGSGLVLDPDDRFLYVTADEIHQNVNHRGEPTNLTSLMVFRRDQSTGMLTLVQQLFRGGEDAAGQATNVGGGAHSPSISSDGRWLFLVTRTQRKNFDGDHLGESGRYVEVYEIDQITGRVALSQTLSDGMAGRGVGDLALDASDRLFVVNSIREGIEVFAK